MWWNIASMKKARARPFDYIRLGSWKERIAPLGRISTWCMSRPIFWEMKMMMWWKKTRRVWLQIFNMDVFEYRFVPSHLSQKMITCRMGDKISRINGYVRKQHLLLRGIEMFNRMWGILLGDMHEVWWLNSYQLDMTTVGPCEITYLLAYQHSILLGV